MPLSPFINEVFWNAPNPMSILDPDDGTIAEVNESYLKFYGYNRKSVIGKKWSQLKHFAPGAAENIFSQLKEKGNAENILLNVRDKKNQERHVLLNVRKIKINDKTLFLTSGTDISQNVLASKKIQDDIIKIYDSCHDEGVLLISHYENKNPSLSYANEAARAVLKKHSFKKLMSKLKARGSTRIMVGSKSYYVKKKGSLDVSAVQIVMIYPLPDSLYIKKTMKKYALTPRKQDVAYMAARGNSNRKIAEKLGISEYTVKEYLKDIFRKIGISHRSELFPKLLSI
jgi:PAS domain S-box-containing protein